MLRKLFVNSERFTTNFKPNKLLIEVIVSLIHFVYIRVANKL